MFGYFDMLLNVVFVNDFEFSVWLEKWILVGWWGNVEEFVGMCIFLFLEVFLFVNGIMVFVDGGILVLL